MDFKDLSVGDAVTYLGHDLEIVDLNSSNESAAFDIHGNRHWYTVAKLNQHGYTHKKAAPRATAPVAALAPILKQIYSTKIMSGEFEFKPAKTRKQVSHNGRDWVDYRLLLDADPFESYEHRREI